MNYGTNIAKGIGSGFVATLVLSVIMLMKQDMGLMPELNPIQMITQMSGAASPAVGWLAHFFIGTILWGALYAWLDPFLPGQHWFRGAIFATGAWLVMMVVMMPMAGAGLLGLHLGMMAPIAALILHWIYGAVLGGIYGVWAHAEHAQPAHAR
ncbi:DUF6789 family protein [Afipia sp. 1NLS2]|uniref:DUF6789 family protein n=1 Tax=Afipia sp. 1NLS2 TaxID=666684 RepID=UPI0001D9F959|nr:DUF6789 family protein [Afipia sp. 1NLS2]EFI53080.1 conserved hypothetical protein [Afipia sp. 1NLS2]